MSFSLTSTGTHPTQLTILNLTASTILGKKYEVLTALDIKTAVFWDVTP
jgi:hypothetical protein